MNATAVNGCHHDIVVTPADIEKIVTDPKSKEYRDLRDRAAYVYITGTYPSHLRTFFTRALTVIMQTWTSPSNPGPMRLNEEMHDKLKLGSHPMVTKVEEYVENGWSIKISKGPNDRKPYTKIFMRKGAEKITVQIDGSIKDSWD